MSELHEKISRESEKWELTSHDEQIKIVINLCIDAAMDEIYKEFPEYDEIAYRILLRLESLKEQDDE